MGTPFVVSQWRYHVWMLKSLFNWARPEPYTLVRLDGSKVQYPSRTRAMRAAFYAAIYYRGPGKPDYVDDGKGTLTMVKSA